MTRCVDLPCQTPLLTTDYDLRLQLFIAFQLSYHMIVLWILISVVSEKIYGAGLQFCSHYKSLPQAFVYAFFFSFFPCMVTELSPLIDCLLVTAASLTCLKDPPRKGEKLTLSPSGTLAAITDSLGRILLLDTQALVVVRLWKVWSVYSHVSSI